MGAVRARSSPQARGASATHSASNDIYPDTQTLSFYGSKYSSPYLDFEPVEDGA